MRRKIELIELIRQNSNETVDSYSRYLLLFFKLFLTVMYITTYNYVWSVLVVLFLRIDYTSVLLLAAKFLSGLYLSGQIDICKKTKIVKQTFNKQKEIFRM